MGSSDSFITSPIPASMFPDNVASFSFSFSFSLSLCSLETRPALLLPLAMASSCSDTADGFLSRTFQMSPLRMSSLAAFQPSVLVSMMVTSVLLYLSPSASAARSARRRFLALAILSFLSLWGRGGGAGIGWSSLIGRGRDCLRKALTAGVSDGAEDGTAKTSEITAASCGCGCGCGELLEQGFGREGLRRGRRCCCCCLGLACLGGDSLTTAGLAW
uniref:Uncharacterized protein n=1 Tax=Arundo donax TaxID=35708 RepID=A0A0A9ETV4_ARUDO